jgi:prepilin-type N-terminal cleavage/methylation domain-containing protein
MVTCGSSASLKKDLWRKENRERGFTLIEIVVTIGITSLLLASMTISGTSIKREFALTKGQEELRSLITYARFLSVATLAAPEEASNQLVCGYGVHISLEENLAYIFRDGGSEDEGSSYCEDKKIGEIINLTDKGSLYSMKLDNLLKFDQPSADQNILFVPPDPQVEFDPSTSDSDGGITIEIKTRDGSDRLRQVRVLASGMVSISR